MNFIDCEQGSDFWKELRCGITTASRAADVIAMTKKGEAATRKHYREELICEILTGIPTEHYVTREMEWGKEQEPFARAAYEIKHEVLVEQVGFVLHPTIHRFGCSPDGLVGEHGMLQIKCPTLGTHLNYLLLGTVPVEHVPQMLAELACTGRKWVDFVSFHPHFPEHLQLFIRRYHRDDGLISKLEAEIVHFNKELDSQMKCLPGKPQGIVLSLDEPRNDEMPEF